MIVCSVSGHTFWFLSSKTYLGLDLPSSPNPKGQLDVLISMRALHAFVETCTSKPTGHAEILPKKKKEDEDEATNKSEMYLKSEWWPDSAPSQVDSRLFKFVAELSDKFKSKRTVSNLHPSEMNILDNLKTDDSIVIALADKGLGPCAVLLRQYIMDGLKHLGDKSTYEIIDEATARSILNE